MKSIEKEAYGPLGDASCHLPLAQLQRRLAALPPPPTEVGRLALIVRRHADGVRETLLEVLLTPEQGVPGDRWSRLGARNPEAQLTAMRREVAELIANGQPLTTFGDNLFVQLDISAANLPVGARLRVGRALLEVTPKPHNGCVKFEGRFGEDALAFVQAPATRPQNLRGIYWKVVEAGPATAGSPIQVLSRP
jgi:MOSC domain-containing protein YiiM